MFCNWRKMLSLLLCLVMVLSFFPVTALAEEGEDNGVVPEEDCDCGHDHEHEAEVGEAPDDPEEAALCVSEDEEIDHDLVRVEFICDPVDTVITVYSPMNLDENGEPLIFEPEEDGSYLLWPGEYLYDAECEGYVSVEEEELNVEKSLKTRFVNVLLLLSSLSVEPVDTSLGLDAQAYANSVNSHAYSNIQLSVNWSHIQSVGHQLSDGQACACYALAYCRTMLDSRVHSWSEFNAAGGTNEYSAYTTWRSGSYAGTFPSDKNTALERMYSEIVSGNPVVVKVAGSRSSHHYVAVVGFTNVTATGSLSASNFLIIDPCASQFAVENMGGVGYDIKYEDSCYQVEYDTTSATVSFSSSSSTGYYLDLNGYLDGVLRDHITGYGTVDVYINGAIDEEDGVGVSDYYKLWPAGTTYEIKNIQFPSYRQYNGLYQHNDLYSGSLSGTIGSSEVKIGLSFSTKEDSLVPAQTMVYGGRTYERYDVSMSWEQAEAICENRGGHLVTITSAEEQASVVSLLADCPMNTYYIGLTDKAVEGTWVWVTGEPFSYDSYDNWDKDLPDPTNEEGENYAQMAGKDNPPNKQIGEWLDCRDYYSIKNFYATWFCGFICEYEVPAEYTISYDANGGTGAPAAQTKTHDVALTLSTTQPTRASEAAGSYTVLLDPNGGSVSQDTLVAARTTSYSFQNWNTEQNGSGTTYASGASYTANAAATLYAQWNSSTATAPVTLPMPTRTGYAFKGWATSASATSGTTGSYTPTGNVTLYAIWEANKYTISYDANGGTGAPEPQIKIHDVALTLCSQQPTRPDESAGSYTVTLNANGGSVSPTSLTAARTTSFTFNNWNTAADCSGTTYAPGASYTANAAATLYAQWNSSTSTAAVTMPTPTRTGYIFKGWATSAEAADGATGSYTPTGNVTLYATWEQETDAKLVVGSGRVIRGEEIQIPVRIEENPGVISIEISVHYDETVLEWTAVTAGEYGGTFLGEVGDTLTWYADDPRENETKDGVFVTLTFRAKDDAATGTTLVSVSYDEENVYNADEENQAFLTVPGEIEVIPYIPGDINGDGVVNNKDLTRLQRYLKGQNVEVQEAALDVNGDGKINNKDASRLQRYLRHGDVEIY